MSRSARGTCPGGSTPNWPRHRQALSRYGNQYAGWVLGLRMSDATSGLRAYRADLLRDIAYDTSNANGYAFMTELAYRISTAQATVAEVPITFTDRRRGTSKMSFAIIAESMSRVTWWGVTVRAKRWRERSPWVVAARSLEPTAGFGSGALPLRDAPRRAGLAFVADRGALGPGPGRDGEGVLAEISQVIHRVGP